MAESTLHPRPNFATFLKSDANGPQDSLSYYEKQRVLRFQKVAVLQQKHENAYVPGYKKRPATVPATTTLAERAEALSKFARPKSAHVHHRVSIDPVPVEIKPTKPQLNNESKVSILPLVPGILGEMSQPSVVLNQKKDHSSLKPIIVNRDRNTKSAASRDKPEGSAEEVEVQKQRPVTVPRVTMKEDGLQRPTKGVCWAINNVVKVWSADAGEKLVNFSPNLTMSFSLTNFNTNCQVIYSLRQDIFKFECLIAVVAINNSHLFLQ